MSKPDLTLWRRHLQALREEIKPRTPFRRAMIHFRALRDLSLFPVADQRWMREALGPYVSRGKGRGSANRVYGNKAGKYTPHQGARECARRVRQMLGFYPGAQSDLMNDRLPRFVAPGVLLVEVPR